MARHGMARWHGTMAPAHLRVDADGGDEDLAAPLHDVGAGEDHRVLVDTLVDLVGLAGQTAFINLKMERR